MAEERSAVVQRVEELAEPIARRMGLVLVDVEYVREGGRRVLRAILHRPRDGAGGGVTLADCEAFSRALSDELDMADPIPESYYLEVASPGLDRVLKRDREFEIFRGSRVRVRTYAPPEGAAPGQRTVTGELLGLAGGMVAVRDEAGRVWEIPRAQVAQVRLDG